MLACATLTYRLRAVFVAAAVILLVGLGCASVDAAPFAVPNPYASGLGDNDIAIRRAVVFGDSYSKYKRKPWHNWAEQLRYDQINPALSKTLITALPAYAVSGATAGIYVGSTNDFTHQVTRWLGTSPKFIARDLTMVYLGYNDINRSLGGWGGELDDVKADYITQLQRIIAVGAAGKSRRIFLIMPHNWGRSPRYNANIQSVETMQERTEIWDAFVADLAHQSAFTNLVALDLFTAMECVFNQPADFGFADVTHMRPKAGDPAKYLYDVNDDLHFGQRGQSLIRQVVQYYLTRGWDWSNTDKNPATARQKLVTDLKGGKVFVGISCDPDWPAVTGAN